MTRSVPTLFAEAMPLSSLPSGPTVNLIERASLLFHNTLNSYSPGFAAILNISLVLGWPCPSFVLSQRFTIGKLHSTRAHFAFWGTPSLTKCVVLFSTRASQLALPTC